jgi:hypothetical protein
MVVVTAEMQILSGKNRCTCSLRSFALGLMDKCTSCCGSFCGCFAKTLRLKASLYVLMFLCLFWAVFNLTLSSITVKPVFEGPLSEVQPFLGCSANDVCSGKPLCSVIFNNPFEFVMTDKSGKLYLRIFCTWYIGPNASRFCCSICCIIMFIMVGIWAIRTPYPKYSKIFHVIPFIAADVWWWAIMVTDATQLIQSNDNCKTLSKRFANDQVTYSVRLSQVFLCDSVLCLHVALQCPIDIFNYTVLCDAACALFFLILPISTFMCSSLRFLLFFALPPHPISHRPSHVQVLQRFHRRVCA